ncbi:hypothetical protein HKX48_009222 [Thoreauomyces humboldtii]|nr:hypothetical protein HKX48_009222 [Thoreauomyces humboldtii]
MGNKQSKERSAAAPPAAPAAPEAVAPIAATSVSALLPPSLPTVRNNLTSEQPAGPAVGAEVAPIAADETFPVAYENFDVSVDPREDFYHYVNKGWMDHNPIPADKTRYGAFEVLADKNDKLLKAILEKVSQPTEPKTLLGEFFASAIDEAQSERVGIDAVKDLLINIKSVSSAEDVVLAAAALHKGAIGHPLWEVQVMPDLKNSDMNLLYLEQSGLGLPDRDYYFDEDKADKREAYKAYIAQIFELAGENDDVKAKVDAIYAVELVMAEATWTRIKRRDVEASYNPHTVDELKAANPNIAWSAYFKTLHFTSEGAFNNTLSVDNPDFFRKIDQLFVETSIEDWRHYLTFHVLRAVAPYASKAFVDASFEFEQKVLSGQQEPKPLWQRVLDPIGAYIPDALSKPYVADNFPPAAKAQLLEVAEYLSDALRQQITNLNWMEDATKAKAMEKLDTLYTKIGYPDTWREYRAAVSRDQSYLQNLRLVKAEEVARILDKAGTKVDRSEWYMPAFMVNAYYNPTANEQVYPAAILQPPFYYPPTAERPLGYPAFTFGAIGVVVGHEMTHGFDDQGNQFDAKGNMVNWWTPQDKQNFKDRVQVIIDQFNEYTVHGVNVKGELTQGENAADLGGCKISFLALQAYVKAKGIKIEDFVVKDPKGVGKDIVLTMNQQFWVSTAQLWRHNITKDAALMRIAMDPHAPGFHRTVGPLSNLQEFWTEYNVQEGQGMRRAADKIVQIW